MLSVVVSVAFSQVYGHGFRPYEYLPQPLHPTSSAANQTLTSGMYGLRTFLYPDIFAVVLYLAKMVGLDWNPYMVKHLHSSVELCTK